MDNQIKSLLTELEKTQKDFWNIHREVGEFLHNLIIEKNLKSVLEIGTSNGYSGIWLASALKKTKGHLYTIESHKKLRYQLGHDNFEKAKLLPYITHILGHAPEAIPQNINFDLAFFDATKYEHSSYFDTVKNQITKNGFIITDNINSHQYMLEDFIEKVENDKNFKSEILNLGTGLLVSQKINN